MGGATYYGNPSNFGGNESPSFEEQKTYMTNMAVRQIEFYFTVENLCRDIFMRSYMDEEVGKPLLSLDLDMRTTSPCRIGFPNRT